MDEEYPGEYIPEEMKTELEKDYARVAKRMAIEQINSTLGINITVDASAIASAVKKPKKKIIKIKPKPKPTKEEDKDLYSPRAYEIIETFMLKHNVYEDRLKAHFREGEIRDGVWFNIWDEDSEDVD
tara:strand:- start:1 stop:381 length:381 start_codon:yes stop_codon:yes gene_type:complete